VKIQFDPDAWDDYLYWQRTDKAMVKRIHALIKDCQRSPFDGIGKPEALKNNFSGYWSRRITQEHRLVYGVFNDRIEILQCRYHY